MFSAPVALQAYLRVFAEEGALDRFEAFASLNGPAFYRLPPNEERVALVREAWTVPARIDAVAAEVVPFHAGATLGWRFAGAG